MAEIDRLSAENEMLRSRLSGLTDAILRINEDLDLDVVLQEVVATSAAGNCSATSTEQMRR